MNWRKIIYHTGYVAGITLSGLLTTLFSDGVITGADLQFAFTSAFISGLVAFVAAFGVESGEHPPEARKGLAGAMFLK